MLWFLLAEVDADFGRTPNRFDFSAASHYMRIQVNYPPREGSFSLSKKHFSYHVYSVRILTVFCIFHKIQYSVHQNEMHRIPIEYMVFCPQKKCSVFLAVFYVFRASPEYNRIRRRIRRVPCILLGPQNTVFWGRTSTPSPPEKVEIRAFFHFVKNTRKTDRIRRNYCIEYHPRGNGQNTARNTRRIHQNTNENTRLTEYRIVAQNTAKNTSENTTQNTSRIKYCPEYNRIRVRIRQNTSAKLVFYDWRRLGASSSEESDSHCKAGRTFRLYPPIFFAF